MQVSEPQIADKSRLIKNWAEDDRPREKLILKGPEALSDSELVCLLIGNGTHRQSAMDLARQVLQHSRDSLQILAKSSVRDLLRLKLKGFGKARVSAIIAAFELGRRRAAGLSPVRPVFKDSKSAAEFLQPLLADYPHEVFGVLYLDQSNSLKQFELISKGGITATVVDPRLIFKRALQEEAVSIIVSHNHPSGNLRPSRADEILTTRIKEGANYLDIKLLDHIIVGTDGFFSFAAEGLLA
jgi:DNA repair protein RadC